MITYIPNYCFSLQRTLECGQCFRYIKNDENNYTIIAFSKVLNIVQENNKILLDCSKIEFDNLWFDYFDFSRDYDAIDSLLCKDERFRVASEYSKGIHILNQEPWETLFSFIISQNNNIPRIKKIVEKLCTEFGENITGKFYSFPSAYKMSILNEKDYEPLKAGFRVKYLMDAAKKVNDKTVVFEKIKKMNINEARNSLMQISGVGPKVADCTLLYGLGYFESFPKDVWIKKALNEYFPDGLPIEVEQVGGIAQQYLFEYIRSISK